MTELASAEMRKFGNVEVWKCENVEVWKCGSVEALGYENPLASLPLPPLCLKMLRRLRQMIK